MGLQFDVMFIDSFMDDVTYVRDVKVRGPFDDQKVARRKRNYCFLSLAEHRTCKSSQYTPYPCHHAGRDSDSLQAGRSGYRIPVDAIFSAPIQTGPEANPASYTLCTGSLPGVKWG